MAIKKLDEVEFGVDLTTFVPNTLLAITTKFAKLVGWDGPRFTDHEAAKKEGLTSAMVPGILSQGYLVAIIHNWVPVAEILAVDTVFRAPVLAHEARTINGVVTDIDEEDGKVEIDLTVANEKGETRIFGTATMKLPQ